ncbi:MULTISPECIES: carbamoyltransferase C-terminal domain-containing protein [Paraburkholderia]|uniref:carbamoyltransferase C-terminal domain-containing protein n=1 Tax=Paraburkholderia TaxID=1822464 RepID=UPI00160A7ABE|nr:MULTISPECIES: carbamoyltransferase C-terminal domain-containing protein [Paraburkholderia]
MIILGISDSHNAAACLYKEDGSLFALQEERPSRTKNYFGVPRQAIAKLLAEHNLTPDDIDEVALANLTPFKPRNREQTIAAFREAGQWKGRVKEWLRHSPIFAAEQKRRREARIRAYVELGFPEKKLKTYEHHSCHAATAYHGSGFYDKPVLVITVDGAGDGLCCTIGVGTDGAIKRLYSVDWSHSIGMVYGLVTYMTGMVPDEHEYKLMGMAPYASPAAAKRICEKMCALFEWDESGKPVWRRRAGVPHVMHMQKTLEAIFFEERFDAMMAGAQLFVEHMMCELARRAIAQTGIRDLVCSGGVFMNVKANKMILELDEVDSLYIFPSCGDETNAIGAAYQAVAQRRGGKSVAPLKGFYLGPEWSEATIAEALKPLQDEGFATVEKPADINAAVVECLTNGEVVARFAGREEFGARSLGNRAILADPRNSSIIQTINKMIKSRDFWMPFASSLQAESESDYLINAKGTPAPYMILSFDTTELGANSLSAGVHPYDKTVRPQVVTREGNPDYWALIDLFRSKTGVGALLNTSLNLHGLPLVHSPADAIEVLRRSGLVRLQIGPFLVTKNV